MIIFGGGVNGQTITHDHWDEGSYVDAYPSNSESDEPSSTPERRPSSARWNKNRKCLVQKKQRNNSGSIWSDSETSFNFMDNTIKQAKLTVLQFINS